MPTLAVTSIRAQRLKCEPPRWRVLFSGLRHPIRFFGELIRRLQDDRTSTVAAALAYYFFFALFPFVLFILALVSLLPVQGLEDWLLEQGARVIPGEAYGMLESVVRGLMQQPRSGLVSVGAVLALWASSSAFAGVMDALTRAYRVPETRPWWRLRLEAIALTTGLSAFMIVTFVLALFGGQLAALVGRTFGPAGAMAAFVGQWVIVIVTISMVVATIYWAGPDVEQRWVWVTPGSLIFTLGFGLASGGFSYYVTRFGAYDKTYGSLGAVIILLFWMYLLGFFLLLGGEVNALLENLALAAREPGAREESPAEVQNALIEREERA